MWHEGETSQVGLDKEIDRTSRQPHWNPCTIESLTEPSRVGSTSEGSVSLISTLGPWRSGPKAQMFRAVSRSHWYLEWKKSPSWRLSQSIDTAPASMSSARPASSASAVMTRRFRWLGVCEKQRMLDVAVTVSQKDTTGSATLTSRLACSWRRSCMMQSRYSSPVPRITCSPDSST